MLRRILIAGGLALALVVGIRIGVRAAEKKPIDSTPPESIVVNLDEFYAQHALKPGVGLDRKDKADLGGGLLIGSTHEVGPTLPV